MKWLEVRRHSLTKKGTDRGHGSHLSADGVALARRVGTELGTFSYVVTSTSPRTIETAIAMGYAVDDVVEMPSGYVHGEVEHHDQWGWPQPHLTYAGLIAAGGGLAAVAAEHHALWTRTVDAVPDENAALIVSHGGSIEPTLVACSPDADHGAWGPPLHHCEGARLGFTGGRFVSIEFRRQIA